MLERILTVALLLGVGYWYWSGPYQQRTTPDYEQKLQINNENMRQCIHGENYKLGATGTGEGDPEERCATKHNLYRHGGQWHSYDDVRPGS